MSPTMYMLPPNSMPQLVRSPGHRFQSPPTGGPNLAASPPYNTGAVPSPSHYVCHKTTTTTTSDTFIWHWIYSLTHSRNAMPLGSSLLSSLMLPTCLSSTFLLTPLTKLSRVSSLRLARLTASRFEVTPPLSMMSYAN